MTTETKPQTARYAVIYGSSVLGYFDAIREAIEYAQGECQRLVTDKRMHFDLRIAVLLGDDCNWPAGL